MRRHPWAKDRSDCAVRRGIRKDHERVRNIATGFCGSSGSRSAGLRRPTDSSPPSRRNRAVGVRRFRLCQVTGLLVDCERRRTSAARGFLPGSRADEPASSASTEFRLQPPRFFYCESYRCDMTSVRVSSGRVRAASAPGREGEGGEVRGGKGRASDRRLAGSGAMMETWSNCRAAAHRKNCLLLLLSGVGALKGCIQYMYPCACRVHATLLC